MEMVLPEEPEHKSFQLIRRPERYPAELSRAVGSIRTM